MTTEDLCDICGGAMAAEGSTHFHAVKDGRDLLPVYTRTGWRRDDVPEAFRRQPEVNVCGNCIGGSNPDHWIAGFTAEMDRLEQEQGSAAARRFVSRLRRERHTAVEREAETDAR